MLENVTVIIPAHNRPERLQRLLDYYSGTGIRVLVPDSSDEPFRGRIDRERITYIHRPRMHFFLKIKEVLPLISTPYVLYCADDDFAVPTGIAKVTEFLDKNPEYSIAQGHYMTFTPDGRGNVKFYPRYIRNFGCRIQDPTAVERMAREGSMYASLLYGVSRTEHFTDSYSYCFDKEGKLRFRNLFLAEEFFNHAMLIHGKYATIPVFFSARERIEGSATDTTTPLREIKSSPEHRVEFDGFVEALTLMLSDREGMPAAEAEKAIRKISTVPIGTPKNVAAKQKIVQSLTKHRLFGWVSRLSDWRYHQKGFKAVKGMESIPCKRITPETEAIVRAVRSTL